jgi:hypothetical protein
MDPLNPTFLVGHHYIKRQPEQMQPVTGNGRKVELKRLGKSLMVDIESLSGRPGNIRGTVFAFNWMFKKTNRKT